MAKSTKKPAAPKSKGLAVHVEVLQNGATLASAERPLTKRGVMALSGETEGELSLPFFPFPDRRLEFARIDRQGVWLTVDHKWEGLCTSGGKPYSLTRKKRGRRNIELKRGDYASIHNEPMRLLIKVGPPSAKAKRHKPRARGEYRGGKMRLWLGSALEAKILAVAALVSLIIVGGFTLGLLQRQVHRPARMADVPERYMTSFVAASHFRDAPEALQQNLDRAHLGRSVVEFYQSFIASMMGWQGYESRHLFPTTIARNEALHADARRRAEEHRERQAEVDREQLGDSDIGVLGVPAVMGESIAGATMRLLDKVDLMHAGLASSLAHKREIIQAYPKDPDYDYEEYRSTGTKNDQAAEYLSKIRPWQKFTDEELMYAEAARLADRADRRRGQQRRDQPDGYRAAITAADEPIGLPPGAKFASFASDIDFMAVDEKLYKLQASEFGRPPAAKATGIAITEPLVGQIDPNLVERFIKQNRYQLQLCYELALRRNEAAAGTMEWRWRIDSRGTISDVALVSSSIKDTRMVQCIRQKITTWRFPRPRRGSVEISFPFEFAPSKG